MSKPVSAIIHGEERSIMAPDMTDAQVASGVFMCTSGLDMVTVIMASRMQDETKKTEMAFQLAMPQIGRDRILHLSQRVERLTEALKNMMGLFDNAVYQRRLADDTMYAEAVKIARAELAVTATKPSREPNVMLRK